MRVLVTGAAGFIGFHCCDALLGLGCEVVGIDSLNAYYDPALKQARLARLAGRAGFSFAAVDCAELPALNGVFSGKRFDRVVHLAAQAGVRHSIANPQAYISANLAGFANILECCRHHQVAHLVYASSSSVYGLNGSLPYSEHAGADHPVSLYAATKRANELMAHSYSHLYRLPATGLRFFTVYGPWGRPDMAYWTFSEKILAGEVIDLFNHGRMKRDFTYVDDVVQAVVRILDRIPAPDADWQARAPDPATSSAPWRIYNIGNHQPVELARFVSVLERALGRPARTRLLPMQAGDVESTAAQNSDLAEAVDFAPRVAIEEGLPKFCAWLLEYRAARAAAGGA